MLEILRKTTVLTAVFALLLPSLCFAEVGNCSCTHGELNSTACECCCAGMASADSAGCSHCQSHTKRHTDDSGDTALGNSACHCEWTTLPLGVFFFNSDVATTTDAHVALALEANSVSRELVCIREPHSLHDGIPPALPDSRFRQIILGVWLT